MKPALIIHGGAGSYAPELSAPRRQGLRNAAEKCWQTLLRGGSALEAVVVAVVEMEDDPVFNAGTGSCLNRDGEIEMDASVMGGITLAAGAVGAVRGVKNPILLARAILEQAKHVLLAAEGAERFARAVGLPFVTREELLVERQWQRWQEACGEAHGTVGAAALDRSGCLAAATSTGGILNKHPGRIGDSAIIGAGTYADNTLGAASATGDGEAIMRVALSHTAVEQLRDGRDPTMVARSVMALLKERGRGEGGIILLDSFGRIGRAHNTPSMNVAYAQGDQEVVVE
jgi:L-asparaginase / beta-aspartyl-peptidase